MGNAGRPRPAAAGSGWPRWRRPQRAGPPGGRPRTGACGHEPTPPSVRKFLRRTGVNQVDSVRRLRGAPRPLHLGRSLLDPRLTSPSSPGKARPRYSRTLLSQTGELRAAQSGERAECVRRWASEVTLANPLDYHTYVWGDQDAMVAAFTAMVRGPADLHLLFADLPGPTAAPTTTGCWPSTRSPAPVPRRAPRGALVAAMAANLTGERAAAWVRRGLAVLAPPAVAMAAIDGRGLRRAGVGGSGGDAGRGAGGRPAAQRRLRGASRAEAAPDEAAGKRLLRAHDVPVPAGLVCDGRRRSRRRGRPRWPGRGEGARRRPQDRAPRRPPRPARPEDVGAAAAELLDGFPALLVERLVTGGVVELLVGRAVRPGVRAGARPRRRRGADRARARRRPPAVARGRGPDPAGTAGAALRPAAHRLPGRASPPPSTARSPSSSGWRRWC